MPYCPKCDMEFVEGIKVCSDCGGPLVESKEVADLMGISQSYISRLEKKIMMRLKKEIVKFE
jgi:transcriptional regulator with XRE-family HTH domain